MIDNEYLDEYNAKPHGIFDAHIGSPSNVFTQSHPIIELIIQNNLLRPIKSKQSLNSLSHAVISSLQISKYSSSFGHLSTKNNIFILC